MERYNISVRRTPQALLLIAALSETPKSARWPNALPKNRPSAALAGAAMLLHVVVGAALLMTVRLPAVPKLPDEQAVALVFAPPQSVSREPLAPDATPDPPLPAEIPGPPEVPVAPPSPPEPSPPPSSAETKSSDAPPPITRPPVAHKTTPRAKPVAPPHIAETPTTGQPHPPDAPASQPASRSPVAEAPVASEWQRSLATWLAAHKTYPDEARRRGTEGNVVLRFTVDRSGRVVDVVLVHSAGSSMLDAAAEAMVRNAMLPPFTAGMSQDTVTITVQIRYALTD
jgi:protein TonB